MVRSAALVLVLTIAAAGCSRPAASAMAVKTSSAVVAGVAQHRTYSHEDSRFAPHGYRAAFGPETVAKIRAQIDAEMQRRGYVLAGDGDLVVRLACGVRVASDTPTGAAAAAGAPSSEDTLGIIVVDIFERGGEGQLFHGYARDELRGATMKEARIAEAVRKVLAPLPDASAASR
jgi:hypothetical protein